MKIRSITVEFADGTVERITPMPDPKTVLDAVVIDYMGRETKIRCPLEKCNGSGYLAHIPPQFCDCPMGRDVERVFNRRVESLREPDALG